MVLLSYFIEIGPNNSVGKNVVLNLIDYTHLKDFFVLLAHALLRNTPAVTELSPGQTY